MRTYEWVRLAFEGSSLAMAVAGRDGRLLLANTAFRELGIDTETLAAAPPVQEAFHSADAEGMARCVVGSPWCAREHSMALTRLSPKDAREPLYLMEFMGGLKDGFLEKALEESERRYYRLQQNLPVGIYRTDETGNLEAANPALIRMVGFSSFEELQAADLELVWADPADRIILINRLRREGSVLGFNTRIMRKDGSEFIASFDAHGTFDRDGRLLYFDTIVQDITEKVNAQQELERLASTDSLTSLHNRQHLMRKLAAELRRSRRYSSPLSMLILDLDHFKRVNDTFGHLAGDSVLREVASRITGALRESDFAGRYGGEEFCVVLPETPLAGAVRIAERLLNRIMNPPVQCGPEGEVEVTCSIGAAEAASDNVEELLGRADEMLYEAKRNGRNRVEPRPTG
jgi:diguanylate cyclase (GGDEF)-like protein/PAS domain S-box-containing protein